MTTDAYFPWEETKEDNIFPTGVYHFKCDKMEDGMSSTQKRMFRAQFTCKQPADYAGMSYFDNYVVGTEENPTGIVPGSMGTRSFKKFLVAAQIPPNNDVNQLMTAAAGTELLLVITAFKETKEGQYKGDNRNKINEYCKVGDKDVGVAPGQGGGNAPGMPVAAAPAPAPVAPPTAPTAPVVPPTQPAAPVAPETPAAPVAPVVPAPVALVAPAANPAQPAAAPAPALTHRCMICQEDVPAAEFAAHAQGHANQ